MRVLALVAVVSAIPAANAFIVDNFEHGNAGLYVPVSAGTNNFSVVGAAAHDGAFGGRFTASGTPWVLNAGAATSPNAVYSAFIRPSGAGTGRVYIGLGASGNSTSGIAYSMVAGNNTNTIVLQRNTNFGFTDLASAPFTFVTDTWYQLRMTWSATGDMSVALFNEAGTSQLAATTTVATGFTGSGGLAMRGFKGSSAAPGMWDVDSVTGTVIPEPASLIALGAGLLAFARRRKR